MNLLYADIVRVGVRVQKKNAIYADPEDFSEKALGAASNARPENKILNSNLPLPFPLQIIKPTDKDCLESQSKDDIKKNLAEIVACTPAPKSEDRGTITISDTIGNDKVDDCMLDIGAAVNVIPYSVYRNMSIGPLQHTNLIIELANRSCAKPEGMLVDVVVHVGELAFLADFYVMKTEEGSGDNVSKPPIILGRPFMMTARTKMDIFSGTVSMEVGDKVIYINVYDSLPHPKDYTDIRKMERLDQFVHNPNVTSNTLLNQVKKKPPEPQGKSSPHGKKRRNRGNKCGVEARESRWVVKSNLKSEPPDGRQSIVGKINVGKAEQKNTSVGRKFDLNQPWDPNL